MITTHSPFAASNCWPSLCTDPIIITAVLPADQAREEFPNKSINHNFPVGILYAGFNLLMVMDWIPFVSTPTGILRACVGAIETAKNIHLLMKERKKIYFEQAVYSSKMTLRGIVAAVPFINLILVPFDSIKISNAITAIRQDTLQNGATYVNRARAFINGKELASKPIRNIAKEGIRDFKSQLENHYHILLCSYGEPLSIILTKA